MPASETIASFGLPTDLSMPLLNVGFISLRLNLSLYKAAGALARAIRLAVSSSRDRRRAAVSHLTPRAGTCHGQRLAERAAVGGPNHLWPAGPIGYFRGART